MGCGNEAIEANRKQAEANQALIEQTQKQLAEIQAQQNTPSTPLPGTPGSCDKNVEETATHRGGDAYAAADLDKALAYYRDALTACSTDAKANLNVARTLEGLGNRDEAISYYRAAADSKGSDPASVQNARDALSRLGVH
jgi:tetratricopeptide (TPR) repeat protein